MRRHGDRVFLTADEAIGLLPENPHTFRGGLPMLIGADCTPERAAELLRDATWVELSGPGTTRMGHGLTLWWLDEERKHYTDGLAMSTDADKLAVLVAESAKLEDGGLPT